MNGSTTSKKDAPANMGYGRWGVLFFWSCPPTPCMTNPWSANSRRRRSTRAKFNFWIHRFCSLWCTAWCF